MKKTICMLLSVIMAFGTFVTMTFGNIPLSDWIDIKEALAAETSLKPVPVFYRYGELVGIYRVNYTDKTKLQYKIGDNGEWTDYSVPFAIPAHQTTKVYARIGTDGNAVYMNFSNTDKAIGVYSESSTDFEFSYNGINFGYTRTYNSADKDWFESIHSKVLVTNSRLEVTLPDGSKYPMIRKDAGTYVDELNGYTLTKTSGSYVFDDGQYKYYFAIKAVNSVAYLSAIEDYNGNRLNLNRTANTDEVSISDGTGRSFALTDLQVIDAPDGSDVNYYSQKEITDPNGNKLHYTTKFGRYIQIEDQAGVTLGKYEYASEASDYTLLKSNGNTIEYYDNGRLKKITYQNGSWIQYTYDDDNMMYTTLTSGGESTKIVYNDAFYPVEYTDEYGIKTEYTYDEHYRVLTEKSDGVTTSYSYDSNGSLLSYSTNSEDNENTYFTYDSNKRLIREKSGESCTYYTYDDKGNILVCASLKEDYEGTAPEAYDASLDCFDVTEYTYDSNGRVTSTKTFTQTTTNYEYDDTGNITKETLNSADDKTSVTNYTYDTLGNVLSESCGDNTVSYFYDSAGRKLLTNDNGEYTRIVYDNLGRVIQKIDPEDYDSAKDGLPNTNTYSDADAGHIYVYDIITGNLAYEINRNKVITHYEYYDTGEKKKETFDKFRFEYNKAGNIENVYVNNLRIQACEYNSNGYLSRERYSDSGERRYSYKDNGKVSLVSKSSTINVIASYSYDDNNNLTRKYNIPSKLEYIYGTDGSVTISSFSPKSVLYSYSENYIPADEENNIEARTEISENHFGTEYNTVIKDDSISYTTGNNTVEYSYMVNDDGMPCSDSVKNGDTYSVSSAYEYDDNCNVINKTVNANGVELEFANIYDSQNRISSYSLGTRETEYTYDENSQLVNVDCGDYHSSYTYDNRGNITSKTVNGETTEFEYFDDSSYISGWGDELVSVNDISVKYDLGNLIRFGDRSFSWDCGRFLAKVTEGDNKYLYAYDEYGIRLSKTVNDVTTKINSKDGVILSQTDGTDSLYFQYDSDGAPLGFILNGTQYFYIVNTMNDVIGITDSNGNPIAEYVYDEWGKPLQINPVEENNSTQLEIANKNPIRYRGYYYDNETGYYYLQSRYYDPSICRFISSDYPEYAQTEKDIYAGINLFAYCCNDPVNYTDYDGYWGKSAHFSWTENWISEWAKTDMYIKNLGIYSVAIARYCMLLDERYPSKYYAGHLYKKNTQKWQYYHFNGNKTGVDSRIEFSDDMLEKAVFSWKSNKHIKKYALTYLGYGLHAIQDIEAHGQIGRGKKIPVHLPNADWVSYVWKDDGHKHLRLKRKGERSRKDDTKDATYDYLIRFCEAIWG